MKKPSLIDRLTGAAAADYDDFFEDEQPTYERPEVGAVEHEEPEGHEQRVHTQHAKDWDQVMQDDGELSVDVYQTDDALVIKALVAGVQPNNVDITLSRDMITIEGTREDEREVDENGYYQRELYWGSFSRTILLPEEVDVDMAEASEKHGILVIRLPKINKAKSTKIKVKSR